ncbi:hypothetical protein LOTGIDRAFT_203919 [Lottia gigantea]|uniref:Thioredoxin n=1 Tax=Lottia gigantea TaxID=225164 RepID=V4BZE6_LOTGI|nr:hypothetical protein LOTGIDRAFT_203919 [Lottia gigantea]ESO94519.1 hypothetical protein LOTGIDRAFT_203919 [Lottia gigantea]
MSVTIINSVEEFKCQLSSCGGKLICIDFSASWCGPCKMIGPKFEAMAKEFDGKFIALKVDVDAVPELSEEYDVSAMPTFLCFKNGKKVAEIVGASEEKLRDMLKCNF